MPDTVNKVFLREVDLYPSVLRLLRRFPNVFAEVPFFGKRVDLVFTTESFRSVYAVETKIDNLRTALKQAALNQLFAQWSFVALPTTFVRRLLPAHRELLKQYRVGLISVDDESTIEIPALRSQFFNLAHHHMVK